MLTGIRVAGFKIALMTISTVLFASAAPVKAEGAFHLEKDRDGMVSPFKVVGLGLSDFVQEYSRFTGTILTVSGPMDKELRGAVTLLIRRPFKQERLTEIFHRVLSDNGFAAIDAPAGNGLVIRRIRDARDAALPVYDSSEVPNSSRYVTAVHQLKYADPESVARMMRSFMPANSRIIPAPGSQIFITDTASNIRRLATIIARMDTEKAARRLSESSHARSRRTGPACGEKRIEKLIVEKLEIQESNLSGSSVSPKMRGRK